MVNKNILNLNGNSFKAIIIANLLQYIKMSNRVLSLVWLFATLWTIAHQAPLSMGFFQQKYWSGLPFFPPEYLPDPGIEPTSPMSLALQVDSLPTKPSGKPRPGTNMKCLIHMDSSNYHNEFLQCTYITLFLWMRELWWRKDSLLSK